MAVTAGASTRPVAASADDVGAPGVLARRPWVVGVDGRSGSGKTRLAADLAAVLGRRRVAGAHALEPVPVVHLDDLYPGWWGLDDGIALLRAWVLEPLACGRPGRLRRYDWSAGRYGAWRDVPAAPLVVVEGVGSGAGRGEGLIDVLVWVEAGQSVRRARVADRDGPAVTAFWDVWAEQEERYLARTGLPGLADVVVDGGTKVP